MFHKILSVVFANSLILYILSKYIEVLWFTIKYDGWFTLEILLLLWLIFWLIYDISNKIVKLLAFPFALITLWLINILINVIFIYLFQYIVNAMNIWATIELSWWFFKVILISIIIYVFNLFFKKL